VSKQHTERLREHSAFSISRHFSRFFTRHVIRKSTGRMPTADMAASLMDNPDFFEALGKLEALPEEDTSEFPELTPPVVPDVKPKPGPIARALRPAADIRAQGPRFVMPPEPNPASPPPVVVERSGMHPAVAVVGFVLMMLVGAGAAVLVFHDRVERIVVQWQAAGR
jgi:hypothetical protein